MHRGALYREGENTDKKTYNSLGPFLFPFLPSPSRRLQHPRSVGELGGGTYCILPVLVIDLDLYGHGLIGSAIAGAAEPRPRPDEPSGLVLVVLGGLLVLRRRAVNIDEVVATRWPLQHSLLRGQGRYVTGKHLHLHRVAHRQLLLHRLVLMLMLLQLHVLPAQMIHVVARLRRAIVYGYRETRHVEFREPLLLPVPAARSRSSELLLLRKASSAVPRDVIPIGSRFGIVTDRRASDRRIAEPDASLLLAHHTVDREREG